MNITDYVPHGLIAAFAGVVAYVFNDHKKQDEDKFSILREDLKAIEQRQTDIVDKMSENHTEILQKFISAGEHAATLATVADALAGRPKT